jgi:hypothetical protein
VIIINFHGIRNAILSSVVVITRSYALHGLCISYLDSIVCESDTQPDVVHSLLLLLAVVVVDDDSTIPNPIVQQMNYLIFLCSRSRSSSVPFGFRYSSDLTTTENP